MKINKAIVVVVLTVVAHVSSVNSMDNRKRPAWDNGETLGFDSGRALGWTGLASVTFLAEKLNWASIYSENKAAKIARGCKITSRIAIIPAASLSFALYSAVLGALCKDESTLQKSLYGVSNIGILPLYAMTSPECLPRYADENFGLSRK